MLLKCSITDSLTLFNSIRFFKLISKALCKPDSATLFISIEYFKLQLNITENLEAES